MWQSRLRTCPRGVRRDVRHVPQQGVQHGRAAPPLAVVLLKRGALARKIL